MDRFTPGQIVEAQYEPDCWYTATVLKVYNSAYRITWFDGSGDERVSEEDVRAVELPQKTSHRYEVGDRVLVNTGANEWHPGSISGLFEQGYHIAWADGSPDGMALERQARRLPRLGEETSRLIPGERVLAQFEEDGVWYPGKVKSTFPDGCDVDWTDGDSARLSYAQVIRESEAMSVSTEDALATTGDETSELLKYLAHRSVSREVVRRGVTTTYCPRCRLHHEVQHFWDTTYGKEFYLCNTGGTLAIIIEGAPARVATPHDFMVEFRPGRGSGGSWLRRAFDKSEFQLSLLPPFVTVTVGRRKD